jgi:CTP:molybdopterin cytidylyltransferase MocA
MIALMTDDPASPADVWGTVGLVLAAGAGRRMGGPKALVTEPSGRRWVDRAVEVLTAGGCAPVVVVLGAAVTEVPGAHVVVAVDWSEGMGSSLRAGLRALPALAPDADRAVIVLVDQPDLSPASVARVAGPGVDAAVATYGGTRGHPVALHRRVWGEVAEAALGDSGAKAWLAAHPDRVVEVPCDGLGSARDVDYPSG